MGFLYLLEQIRNPVLDVVMEIITSFGSELLFYVFAMFLLWCVDKREGAYVLLVGFFGAVVNQVLKLACRVERPWVRDPNFSIVETARAEATGYSFPSGHSQNVTATFGAVARWNRVRWLRIVSTVMIALVCFSRMYLGVHTPADVLTGLALSIVIVFAFYPLVRRAFDSEKRMAVLLGAMLLCAVGYIGYTCIDALHTQTDPAQLLTSRKLACDITGALLGYIAGFFLERRFIRYETKGVWYVQALKLIFGLGLLLAIKSGLKELFVLAGLTSLAFELLRYFVMVLFATALWPMTFRPLTRLLTKEKVK